MSCLFRRSKKSDTRKTKTNARLSFEAASRVKDSKADWQHGDDTLIDNLKRRLKKFTRSMPVAQQDEMDSILNEELELVNTRLRDLRFCLDRLEKPNSASELIIALKKMQMGERGEAEAADWVLRTFYNEIHGRRSSQLSQAGNEPECGERENSKTHDHWAQENNYLEWQKSVKETITKEAIMEAFARSNANKKDGSEPDFVDLDRPTNDDPPQPLAGGSLKDVQGLLDHWKTPPAAQQKPGVVIRAQDPPEEKKRPPASSLPTNGSTDSLAPPRTPSEEEKNEPFLANMVEKPRSTSTSLVYNPDGSRKANRLAPSLSNNHAKSPRIFDNPSMTIRLGWEMDVARFADIPEVGGMPLLVIGHYIIVQTGVDKVLNLDMDAVHNWLRAIETSYLDNPYHNHVHAADVMCSMYYWFTSKLFKENMTSLDVICALMAAAAHDVGHDGVSNKFHNTTHSRLAIEYNDKSPLENYHSSLAFRLLFKPENNWIANFTHEQQQYVRNTIINLILATDMAFHKKLQNGIEKLSKELSMSKDANGRNKLRTKADAATNDDMKVRVSGEACEKQLVLKVGLHLADIANPAKPQKICTYWAKRVVQEFFEQGDKEKAMNIEISPLCDRENSNMEEGQKGFIKFVVKPIYEPWARLMPEASCCVKYLDENYKFWDSRRHSGFLRSQLLEINKELQRTQPRTPAMSPEEQSSPKSSPKNDDETAVDTDRLSCIPEGLSKSPTNASSSSKGGGTDRIATDKPAPQQHFSL